jgi:hypothetical protein
LVLVTTFYTKFGYTHRLAFRCVQPDSLKR